MAVIIHEFDIQIAASHPPAATATAAPGPQPAPVPQSPPLRPQDLVDVLRWHAQRTARRAAD